MRTRPVMQRRIEIALACGVLVYGIRTAVPLSAGAMYTSLAWRIVFGVIVLLPAVVLLAWPHRYGQKALLGVAGSNLYVVAGILWSDWTRMGSAAAALTLSVIAFILYAGARAEGQA